MSDEKKALSKKAEYDLNYAKTRLKRVPLDMQLSAYEELKEAASRAGEGVNTYIKKAIQQRIESERAAGDGFHISEASDEK